MRTCMLPVGAIDSINTVSKHSIQITFRSMHNDYEKTLTFLTIGKIADAVPSETFSRDFIKIPKNIRLAETEFHRSKSVDMLIGSGPTLSLFSIGQIEISHDKYDLCLHKTRLGWIVAGGIIAKNRGLVKCAMTKLESLVEKFWKMEEIIDDESKTKKEIECENHFKQNYTRDKAGRYILRLPFRKTNAILEDSRGSALRRLVTLERKFERDNSLRYEYVKVINEYLELGHLSLIENPCNNGYYLPHHDVIKQSSTTTKVRVVFDASSKSSTGVSLNDLLMVGPTIQDKIFTHLVRFRSHKFVMTADMKQMYRQVLIHEDDRIFQRILWRHNGEVKTFQLNTVTFGVSSAPFLAIRTVQQLADDESKDFPAASKILKRDLYVDDLSTGAETIEGARKVQDEIIEVLNRGGFSIRQWASNNERILEGLTNKMLNAKFSLDKESNLKTLGLSWSAKEDKIQYSVNSIELKSKITKRNVLSEIAKIFDPLGLLGPVTLFAKQIMQDLWKCKLHWDESLPQTLHTKWSDFATELNLLNDISFDRHIKIDHCQYIELHGFSDASNKGYGACIYLRTTNEVGNSYCKLICAKSRVAPIKPTTIPRLELNGALLLARLIKEVLRAFDFSPRSIILWCDSIIVLQWLEIPPNTFKTYVANRLIEIQNLTEKCHWRYIRSKDNPADALSRGQMPSTFLNNKLWAEGPKWLKESTNNWPNETFNQLKNLPELKTNICMSSSVQFKDEINQTNRTKCNNNSNMENCINFKKYSSYTQLLKIVAYCLRFCPSNTHKGLLQPGEIDEAETRILKSVQNSHLTDIIGKLHNKNRSLKKKYDALNPFIDEQGLLRVGGRLQHSNLNFNQKHPILLPKAHYLTDLIIRETHLRCYHSGVQTTLYAMRQKYWVVDGRNQVRRVIWKCVRCARYNRI